MSGMPQPRTAKELVQEARENVENLSVEQVAGELVRGCILVDVREADERRREGVIPGAVHAPRGLLEFIADPASPYYRAEFVREKRLILHCASGGRSALAASTLKTMGYGNVAHLHGGFQAWKRQGQAVDAHE